MSRRFGRNQKRAFRQALADGQSREIGLQRDNRMLSQVAREAKEGLAYIKESIRREIGPESTLLPPSTTMMREPEHFRRMLTQAPADFRDYGARFDNEPVAMQVSSLAHVVSRIKSTDCRQHVHLFLESNARNGEREWRYVIDEDALLRFGIHPGVLRDIAQRVAQDIVLSLERSLRGGVKPAQVKP